MTSSPFATSSNQVISRRSPGFGVRNPAPVVINPRPRRIEPTRTGGTRPQIDTDCTSEVKWARLQGPKGDRGPQGPPGAAGRDGRDGKDGQVTDDDIARIVVSVVEQLRGDPSLIGKDGKDGAVGPTGPPGKDAIVDIDAITEQVLLRLPAISVQQLNKSGKVLHTGEVYLGGTLKLYHDSNEPYRPVN